MKQGTVDGVTDQAPSTVPGAREIERRRKIGEATSARRKGKPREAGAAAKQIATMRASGALQRKMDRLAMRNRGRSLSPEHRSKISAGNRRRTVTAATRQKHRLRALRQWREGRVSPDVGRGRRFGRSDLGGVAFRSRWEANFARVLSAVGIAWEYEPQRFVFPDGSTYCPDFRLATGVFIEIKGWLSPQAAKKIRMFRVHFPQHTLHVIDPPRYRRIESRWSEYLPLWESK